MTDRLVRPLWRDADGFLHAEVAEGYEMLRDLLITDMDRYGNMEFLSVRDLVSRAMRGEATADDAMSFNSFWIEVDGERTTLQYGHRDDLVLVMSTEDLRDALDTYAAFRESQDGPDWSRK